MLRIVEAGLETRIFSSSNTRCVAFADVQAKLESIGNFSTTVIHAFDYYNRVLESEKP